MRYFRLATDCFLVEGNQDGAVYDVHGKQIFLLDEAAHRVLRRCENNEPIDDWIGDSGISLLKSLEDAGLGFFEEAPIHVDKLLLHQPVEWKGMCMVPPEFFRADWSITNRCDLDCAWCGQQGGTVSWQSCQSCLRRGKGTEQQWLPESPEDFVAQLARLGTKVIHLRGGNPLLEWDYLQRIVDAATRNSLGVVITTPGTGREVSEIVSLCAGGAVRLNLVFLALDPATASTLDLPEDLLTQQFALADALAEAEIPYFITCLLTKDTRWQRPLINAYVAQRWRGQPSFAEVYLKRELPPDFRLSQVGTDTKPLTPWQSAEEFFFRVRHNGCTAGNFEVSSDGKLRTCAGIHQVHGDIARQGLRDALKSEGLYAMWELAKGKVEPCQGCALRYACSDCSVFELAGEQDHQLRQAYCPHELGPDAPRAYQKEWIAPLEFVGKLTLAETE